MLLGLWPNITPLSQVCLGTSPTEEQDEHQESSTAPPHQRQLIMEEEEEEEEEAGEEVPDHNKAEVDASDRQRKMITKGKSNPQRMTRLGRTNSLRLVSVFF